MGRLAIVAGHGMLGAEPTARAARIEVATPSGPVTLLDLDDYVLLQRHGLDRYRAPHAIDHAANVTALSEVGCDRVLGFGSVGALRCELAVGTFVAPDDFIALHLGRAAFDDHRGHVVAGLDPSWRAEVIETWARSANPPLLDGGVYWQAVGPRFETAAEIRMIAAHADVVGMTIAAECVSATENGLPYAAVCVVDNLANGIGAEPLTPAEHERGKLANRSRLLAAIEAIGPTLAEGPS